jgi:Helitron helicase-like domain at N-terminus
LNLVETKGMCHDCVKLKNVKFFEEKKLLPVWYNREGVTQYHVPDELACLTLAEKMLIQLASPFIPLQHIKKGIFGLKGHVCCFEQDVVTFVNTLPRHPTEVTVLKVLKEVAVEIGGTGTRTSVYTVRRKKIGEALLWLKEYNVEYKHIQIDMTALNWLDGDEGSLYTYVLPDEEETADNIYIDMGPSPTMTMGTLECGDAIKAFGYIDESPGEFLSSNDTEVHNDIVEEVDRSKEKKEIRVQWPSTGPVAINEYSSKRIFVRAFPWLFPGGLGDAKDAGDDLCKWGQRLLFYEDGRFATDKYFTFYAQNYITRHRNAKSGGWFIKGFNKNGPQNLAELKASIRSGDVQFINRLMYYNKHVTGSNPYWFQKRNEVYSWVNHHVEAGHGPPNLFITLSCAEYYWPDILRLIQKRMEVANDVRSKVCYRGSPRLTEIINDYTVIVQEFFQVRFELWMKHFGEPIFGIKHYWGRYEFAPGRGQIHIHLLAIRKDQNIFKLCHGDLKGPGGKEKRDLRLAQWASQQFGLTASVDDGFQERSIAPEDSPLQY